MQGSHLSRRVLQFLTGIALALMVLAGPGLAQDRKVSTPQELAQALKETTGGVIVIAPGDYGDLVLSKRRFEQPVILRAEVPRKAVFDKILVADSENLWFENLRTTAQFRADRSKGLRLTGCASGNVLYFRSVEDLLVENCHVQAGRFGILFNSVSHFVLRHSQVGGATEDVMRITGKSAHGLIEHNILADTLAKKPTHPDLIQTFSADGATPRDITIRANLLYDDPATGDSNTAAQGIFMAGGGTTGYKNILIENNLIYTRSANTIFMGGGQDKVVIRNNTLLPSTGNGGAIIRLSSFKGFDNSGTTVEGNVAKMVLDESRASKVGRNYLFGRDTRISALFPGPGLRWQDFLPVSGTAVDKPGIGAATFVYDLLAAQKPGAKGGPRLGPDWSE